MNVTKRTVLLLAETYPFDGRERSFLQPELEALSRGTTLVISPVHLLMVTAPTWPVAEGTRRSAVQSSRLWRGRTTGAVEPASQGDGDDRAAPSTGVAHAQVAARIAYRNCFLAAGGRLFVVEFNHRPRRGSRP